MDKEQAEKLIQVFNKRANKALERYDSCEEKEGKRAERFFTEWCTWSDARGLLEDALYGW
jgi:hypothetical protein